MNFYLTVEYFSCNLPPMNNELIKRVENKILETFLLARKSFGKVFELPQLSFELKSSKVAGQAHLCSWKIKINR